jgi:hypothetical protein
MSKRSELLFREKLENFGEKIWIQRRERKEREKGEKRK